MGEIKSALELALERTEGIKGDKETLQKHQAEEDGKKAASQFLQNPEESDLGKFVKQYSGEYREIVRAGIMSVLLANVILPATAENSSRLKIVEKGLSAVAGNKRQVGYIIQQIEQFFTQYLDNREQVTQRLSKQYEPRLRQKEEELAKQFGSQVKIDMKQDPEYLQTLRQTLSRLEEQYQEALAQAKDELRKSCS